MATPYDNIYDLFLAGIKDYKLDKLYAQSEEDFKLFLQGFLLKAIPKFTNCKKDLSNRDNNTAMFNDDLNDLELNILADLMTIEWLNREINDITQISLHIGGAEFKWYAEANNLDKKKEHKNELREIASQQMTDYALKNTPWSEWASGSYE